MSCESRWHSRHKTLRQEVGSLPISGGVGGGRYLGEEDCVGAGVGVAGEGGDGGADVADGEQEDVEEVRLSGMFMEVQSKNNTLVFLHRVSKYFFDSSQTWRSCWDLDLKL
jgi:hypothetical protein